MRNNPYKQTYHVVAQFLCLNEISKFGETRFFTVDSWTGCMELDDNKA